MEGFYICKPVRQFKTQQLQNHVPPHNFFTLPISNGFPNLLKRSRTALTYKEGIWANLKSTLRCVWFLGDVVFGLRQNGYEISRKNLIKVFANKRMHLVNECEDECYKSIINKLSDA